ncbi:MAG: hypothetical protein IIU58_03415 [Clostridia bacterium]|nr:hypothetical protein [Clostridia bacterium]
MLETRPMAKGSAKALEVFGFSGLYDSMRKSGMLLDCDNVHVLSGGAVASLLADKKIDITANMPEPIAGVYTYYSRHDPRYERVTTTEWVYQNVCPADVLNYADGTTYASRLLIADVGMPAKTENGYRDLLGAFSDGQNTYILYTAVYNLVDQRRYIEIEGSDTGIKILFDSCTDEEYGSFAKVCTLTQVFLDVIGEDQTVTTTLLTANLEVHRTLPASYGYSVMVSTDRVNYRYVSLDYTPSIGMGYTIYEDKVYNLIYPELATAYEAIANPPILPTGMVRYRNRIHGDAPYGSQGEKLLLLPDMRLLTDTGSGWKLEAPSETMPVMRAAVQHFERLFGIYYDRVYASVSGNCSDFTEAVDNLPATDGWQAVTGDAGGFTAIASFDGKVIIFTAQNMMTVRGTDLPFSLSCVGSFGCTNQKSLAVCGDWLYFISADGIRRYNGSRVESIGDALPRGLRYTDATLTAVNGLVIVHLDDFDGLYIYDPASEAWSRCARGVDGIRLVVGGSRTALHWQNGATMPYALFEERGEFSFSISLAHGGRRRVRSVAVTARLAPEASLRICDAAGRELLYMDGLYDETATRTCLVRGMYQDGGALYFSGRGEITLYGVRITYAPMHNASRKINE